MPKFINSLCNLDHAELDKLWREYHMVIIYKNALEATSYIYLSGNIYIKMNKSFKQWFKSALLFKRMVHKKYYTVQITYN